MYRGSQPTSGCDQRHISPPAAMLVDMNRLPSIPSIPIPSIPSRPAPQQHFSGPSYAAFHRPAFAAPPDNSVSQSHHHREGGHSNAPQLPSLRQILQPQALSLDTTNTLPEPGPRLTGGGGGGSGGGGSSANPAPNRYGSSSPTLKRRHDFDGYSHERTEGNVLRSRTPPGLRHASGLSTGGGDSQQQQQQQQQPFSTPNSATTTTALGRTPDFGGRQHHGGGYSTHYRPSPVASTSAVSVSSEPPLLTQTGSLDEGVEAAKGPGRRRTDASSRMPIRASRCVGQREIPGEGLCYVYDDGTYCRAIIDGEPVNPSWGITKAGKPRKRLAQACLTCREKKIKCEPGYPKCHQCAKSQRACRGGLSQQPAGMSNASTEDTTTRPSSSSAGLYKKHHDAVDLSSPVAGPDISHTTPFPRALDESRDPIRLRAFRSKKVSEGRGRGMSVHSFDTDWSGSLNDADPEDSRRGNFQDQLALHWDRDPFEADPQLTLQLLDLYFRQVGRATYGMFPRQPFTAWVQGSREKNQDDRMVLYSVLAMGSVFSPEDEHRSYGKHFAAIAAYAIEKRFGKFTLQLCQSRLMLALYNFARGKPTQAWDFCGAGLRAISALKLNTEEGIRELSDEPELDYGFDRWTLEECCRRTFWSGFLMDRYNGFCGGTLCVINPEDTFLRLPCLETAYEASTPCDTPLFDFDLLAPSSSSSSGPSLGIMAYLTLISTIWGEVLTFTSRAVHKPEAAYERYYETFYNKTNEQLNAWLHMLPPQLQYSNQNLDASIAEGYAGTFLSLHALYCTTIIRLNRHVRVRLLCPASLRRNLTCIFRSAADFLTIMHSLSPSSRPPRFSPQTTDALFSVPFPGYAMMLSVDVLSSCGTIERLHDLISSLGVTLSCLEELGVFWASARAQHKATASRVKQLGDVSWNEEQGVQNGSLGAFWRLPEALEMAFGNEDAVYHAPDPLLFDVVAEFTRG